MKKQLLALSLVCVLPLMGIQPANLKAQLQAKIPPQLKTVLTKKYIHKLPLTEQQQAYLKRVDRKTIIAGLAALGIAAIAVAGGIFVSKKLQQPQQISPATTKDEYIAKLNALEVPNRLDVMDIISELANDHFGGNTLKAQQFVEKSIPNFLKQHGFGRASALD